MHQRARSLQVYLQHPKRAESRDERDAERGESSCTQSISVLQSVRSEDKRRVMELAQVDFRRRAELYGIPVNYRPFGIDDIRAALAQGKLVVVLVSGFLMFGKKVPHWVLAIGDDGDHILIHDPWVEDERQETILDAANIPVPYDIFMNMAQFGRDGLRAAITLGKR